MQKLKKWKGIAIQANPYSGAVKANLRTVFMNLGTFPESNSGFSIALIKH